MEVASDGLETGNGFVGVIVRIGHHLLLRLARARSAQVVVDGHALHRARRRVVERVVVNLRTRDMDAPVPHLVRDAPWIITLAMFRLHHTERKLVVAVLAVVDVAKVDLVLARKEKFVRRRKYGERTRAGVENLKPIAGLQADRLCVEIPAKLVLLPFLRIVSPFELSDRLT